MTNKFDIDLAYGLGVENKLLEALKGDKIEVKAERAHWQRTGNIAIETFSRGKPSGINVTEADYWAHTLMRENGEPYCFMLFPTPVLKGIVRFYLDNRPECVKMGGDGGTSEMILLPLKEIIKPRKV